ncbi:STAS domain-containing protein [Streptomyces gamaensis]|uniref:STAS domain-containing protein n=1 Tax=Streptomyces gamaensis TaxID=1763542 RepID=A0ABW0YXB6_9ACTN
MAHRNGARRRVHADDRPPRSPARPPGAPQLPPPPDTLAAAGPSEPAGRDARGTGRREPGESGEPYADAPEGPCHQALPAAQFGPRAAGLTVVRTCSPPGLRIEGVVDAGSHQQLRDALRSVASVRGDLRLEVSRVEFPDLSGLRLLMSFARARAARHRTVELSGLLPSLLQVITIVGWDRTPGLRLGAARGRPGTGGR